MNECKEKHQQYWELIGHPMGDGRFYAVSIECPWCDEVRAERKFSRNVLESRAQEVLGWLAEQWPECTAEEWYQRLLPDHPPDEPAEDTELALAERLGNELPADMIRDMAAAADEAGVTVRRIGGDHDR